MEKKLTKILYALAIISLLSSCGDQKDKKKESIQGVVATTPPREEEEVIPVDGSNINGFYLATFQTINKHIVGTIPGSASFTRDEDRLFVYMRLFAGAPKAWHMQAVYTGSRCPTLKDDKNGDGTIDIQEALAVVGKVLIPLDSDPGTQASGRAFYPLGDLSGSYHYERVVNFKRFLSDLQSEDKDPEDNIVKLAPGTGLNLVGKVIMIQGIGEETQLPETVATYGRRSPFQTLPIACGVYKKIEKTPGEPLGEGIPGPVAEVQEGQDRPAPEETPDATGGGSGGSTTGTNESDDGNGPVSDGEGRTSGSSTGGGRTSGGSSTGGNTGNSTGGWTGRTSSGTTGGGTGSTSGNSSTTGGSGGHDSDSNTTTGSSSSTSGN